MTDDSSLDLAFEGLAIKRVSLDSVNDDILGRIFDFLHLEDKIRLRRTSRRWMHILNDQLRQTQALRLGHFHYAGSLVSSGLELDCEHSKKIGRKQTGAFAHSQLLSKSVDLETLSFDIVRYDLLNGLLRNFRQTLTTLSVGHIHITYPLMITLACDLPHLEHLEFIRCSASMDSPRELGLKAHHFSGIFDNGQRPRVNERLIKMFVEQQEQSQTSEQLLPSMDSVDLMEGRDFLRGSHWNSSQTESDKQAERLSKAREIKTSYLVQLAKQWLLWPKFRHLYLRDCHLFNEYSLSVILAITQHNSLELHIESHQYLTGEFLNFCGTKLNLLNVKYCPSMELKFLEDFIKIRKFFPLASQQSDIACKDDRSNVVRTVDNNFAQTQLTSRAQVKAITSQFQSDFRNFRQEIYCTF